MAGIWKGIGEGTGGALVIIGSLATPFLRSWRSNWGTTIAEREGRLTGDELISHPKWQYTNAITINAPAAKIWPWLVQMGQGRGGWYSYESLENMVGCKIKNADRIIPEFQNIEVGDSIRLADNMPGYPVAIVEPEHAIVLYTDSRKGETPIPTGKKSGDFFTSTWTFELKEIDTNHTRFISRLRNDYNPRLANNLMFGTLLVEPISTAMQRKMLKEIKKRAEAY